MHCSVTRFIASNGSRSRRVSRTVTERFGYYNMCMGRVQRKSRGAALTALPLLVHTCLPGLLQNCSVFFS